MTDFLNDDDDYFDDDEFVGRSLGQSLGPGLVLHQPGGLLGQDFSGLFSMGVFPAGAPGRTAPPGVPPRSAAADSAKMSPPHGRPATAFGTHEQTPGATLIHLPAVYGGSIATRRDFANDWRSWWRGRDWRDILYRQQGVPTGLTRSSIGYFEGQVNPGQAATPSVFLKGPPGERLVADASRRTATSTEAARAYFDGQDGGGWSIPLRRTELSHSNGFEVTLPKETPRWLLEAQSIGNSFGLPHIIHYGGRRAFVAQLDPKKQVPITPDLARAIHAEMQTRLGSRAKPMYLDGDFAEYTWDAGVGSGTATRQLLDYIGPAQIRALESPEARERILARFDRDAEVAANLRTPLRRDLQNARRIFVRRGIEGLDAALKSGTLPVAAVGLFVPYLLNGLDARDGGSDDRAPASRRRRRRRRDTTYDK
jgi:hypothetical protein